MEIVRKLEDSIAKMMASMPHLPAGGRKWLGENVWWIVLVGASLGALSIIVGLVNLMNTITMVNAFSAYVPVGSYGIGWAITTAVVGMIFSAMQIVVLALAIKPLKEGKRSGWNLLFMATLVAAVAAVVAGVLTLNVLSFILTILFSAIFLGISLYFTFEIREHFAGTAKPAAEKPAKK